MSTVSADIIPNNPHQPSCNTGATEDNVSRLKIISSGMAIGKPITAIKAAFCLARAATADKKVNKTLNAAAPEQAANTKRPKWVIGLPSNKQNKPNAKAVSSNIEHRLYTILESTYHPGAISVK